MNYNFLKQEKNDKGVYTTFEYENGDILLIKSNNFLDVNFYLEKLNNYKNYSEILSNKYLTLSQQQLDFILENSVHYENKETPTASFTSFLPKFIKNVTFKNGKTCKLYNALSVFQNIAPGGDFIFSELYFLKIYVDEKNENNLHLFSTLKNRFKGINCFQYFKNVFETTIFLTGNSLKAIQKQYDLWPDLIITTKRSKNE